MITKKRRKSKSKRSKKSGSKQYKKRSLAAKKGWETRRKKTKKKSRKSKEVFLASEIQRLQKELNKTRREFKSVIENISQSETIVTSLREQVKELKKEKVIKELHIENLEDEIKKPSIRSPRSMPMDEAVQIHLDRAWRLYGPGPGIYDTALELAEYYDVDIQEVFDLWETPD